MYIDAHQHFWKISREDYGWLKPENSLLYQDYLPEDLQSAMKNTNINKTIIVQAASTIEETDYLLKLFDENKFIAGVVGWLDFESNDFSKDFFRLLNHPGFVGVRLSIKNLQEKKNIDKKQLLENIGILFENEFPVDLLAGPDQLPFVAQLLNEYPMLHVVLNHCGEPDIKNDSYEIWSQRLTEVASFKNVACKLSGLINLAGKNNSITQLKPYVNHVLKVFGTGRVLYGSDWPISFQTKNYEQVYETFQLLLDNLTNEERDKIFGENAKRIYKL